MPLLNVANPIIALDDGHGMATPGKRTPVFPAGSGLKSETGNFMHENEFNRAVVKYLDVELRRCGFRTVFTAPGDGDTPIGTRVKNADKAGAHILLSVHANALNAQWNNANGIETLVGVSAKDKQLAAVYHKHIKGGTPQRDRGLKDGSWLGLQAAKAPVLLFEFGFMDNLAEAKLLLSDAYRRECARELAQATCEVFGKKYVPTGTTASKPATNNYPYDKTKGIGTVQIIVDELNCRKGASFSAPVMSVLKKWNTFYVYEEKNGMYRVSNEGWISANSKYVKYTPHPK